MLTARKLMQKKLGDVEASLALFDPAAQVKVPPDLYQGAAQIRGWLSYLAANHFAEIFARVVDRAVVITRRPAGLRAQ